MQQLRIGVDGYNLAMPRGTGIATYGLALARTLRAGGHEIDGLFGLDVGRNPAVREAKFYDLLQREESSLTRRQARRARTQLVRTAAWPFLSIRADDVPITDRVEKGGFTARLPAFDRLVSAARLFDIAHRHFAFYKRFVRVRMANPPQIMHWTYPLPVELVGSRNIYTLHDLVPLKLPYTTLDDKAAYHALAQRCVERGAHICTVSEASRSDIIAQFGANPEGVTNTFQASPPSEGDVATDAAEDAASIEGIFGLPRRGFFLFFGSIEPKKNLGRLIEAYLSIRTDTPLVIVGARAWRSAEELRLLADGDAQGDVHARSVSNRVIRLEFLPRALLLRLIRSAKAVVFPSLYEGFGLPVLEAMQLGTPVLTSSTSSLPEVAGQAALLVDPYSVRDIGEALRRLDGDPALCARLAAEGPIRASLFSQDRYLERLDRMYAGVMAGGRPV